MSSLNEKESQPYADAPLVSILCAKRWPPTGDVETPAIGPCFLRGVGLAPIIEGFAGGASNGRPSTRLYSWFPPSRRYTILAPNALPKGFVDARAATEKLLEATKLDTSEFQLGLTKVRAEPTSLVISFWSRGTATSNAMVERHLLFLLLLTIDLILPNFLTQQQSVSKHLVNHSVN